MPRPAPRRRLANALLFAAALVLLAEEWLWDTLRQGMRALAKWAHVQAFERWLQSLPPWPALAMLLAPVLVLVPFKFAGMWALTHGRWLAGLMVIVVAKVAGTAVAAFIFVNVKEPARRIAWFDRLYGSGMRALAWAHAWARAQPAYRRARRLMTRAAWNLRLFARAEDRSAMLRRWAAVRRLARARR
jgi:hypothetical protein